MNCLNRRLSSLKIIFVFSQANRTFSDIEKLQLLAKDWLNTSQKIRTVLQQNESQYYLGLMLNSEHKCLRRYDDLAYNTSGYRPADKIK